MMEQHDDGFVLSHHLKRALPGLPVILVTAVTSETGLSLRPVERGGARVGRRRRAARQADPVRAAAREIDQAAQDRR